MSEDNKTGQDLIRNEETISNTNKKMSNITLEKKGIFYYVIFP